MPSETGSCLQDDVIAFLSDPSTYGERKESGPVERIDTHISHLFLTPGRVYKLKRAVALEFLDFTALENREAACRRELEINRQTAPELYMRVLPITRTGDRLCLGGAGTVRDWVVEMKRFEDGARFDAMADAGRLTPLHLRGLADAIAAFHRGASQRRRSGGAGRVEATVLQVAESLHRVAAISPCRVSRWEMRAMAQAGRWARRLEARGRHGYVRRCHGDLHLANICLFEGRPTPFDAIEFDEEIATIDVLYDIAFPVMDCLYHEEKAGANLLLNRYLAWTRDYRGAALLPLFLSLRAAVRAMAKGLAGPDDAEAGRVAGRYFQFAEDLLAAQPEPRLIAIGGVSGTGKSTVAQGIAPLLGPGAGGIVLRSDEIRKHLFGHAPEDSLPEAAYAEPVSVDVYRRMLRSAGHALRSGMAVILDATFLKESERAQAAALAKRAGCAFTGLWLEAPEAVLAERIAGRRGDASDADVAVLARQQQWVVPPRDWLRIEAGAGAAVTIDRARMAIHEATTGGRPPVEGDADDQPSHSIRHN